MSSGVDSLIVSNRLGHATMALTLDIYSHVLPRADAEAAERIAALLPAPEGRWRAAECSAVMVRDGVSWRQNAASALFGVDGLPQKEL